MNGYLLKMIRVPKHYNIFTSVDKSHFRDKMTEIQDSRAARRVPLPEVIIITSLAAIKKMMP